MTLEHLYRWLKKLWRNQTDLEMDQIELRKEFMLLQIELRAIKGGKE